MASKKQWMQYVQLMSQLKGTARKQMDDYLAKYGTGDMEAVIKYAFSLATKYGEGTSAVAAEMYDAVAKSQGAKVPAAELASTASYEDTAKAVTHAKGVSDRNIPGAVETLVKQAGEDTTIKNAIRDGAEFAWIPSGDSCPFCLTLASGGWRHASKKTLKGDHADHIHTHCDCSFAIRFDGKTSVEGYDPDKLRELYENADGRTWKDKINSMRREQYELDGEKIRAQKRAAYKRKHPVRGATDTGEAIVMADGQEIPYGSRAGFTGMTRDQAVKQAQMYSLNKSRNIQSENSKRLRIPQIPASTVTEKVKKGEYSLKLSQQQYDKHQDGTRDYIRYQEQRKLKGYGPQSRLTITREEAQEIIVKQSGTGIIKARRDGSPTDVEQITCDRVIGEYFQKGKWISTNKAAIHHGKRGSHMVPIKGNNYD